MTVVNTGTQTDYKDRQNAGGQQKNYRNSYQSNQQYGYTNASYEAPDLGQFATYSDGTPMDYRGLFKFILLTIFTFGIYYIYTVYRLTEFGNKDPMRPTHTPWLQVLLCIFASPYNIYWHYDMARRLNDMYRYRYGKDDDLPIICLILTLCGAASVSMVLIQNMVNKVVGGFTGKGENSTGYGKCSSCGHDDFPDDVEYCPHCNTPYTKPLSRKLSFQIVVAVLGTILFFILVAFLLSVA